MFKINSFLTHLINVAAPMAENVKFLKIFIKTAIDLNSCLGINLKISEMNSFVSIHVLLQ